MRGFVDSRRWSKDPNSDTLGRSNGLVGRTREFREPVKLGPGNRFCDLLLEERTALFVVKLDDLPEVVDPRPFHINVIGDEFDDGLFQELIPSATMIAAGFVFDFLN